MEQHASMHDHDVKMPEQLFELLKHALDVDPDERISPTQLYSEFCRIAEQVLDELRTCREVLERLFERSNTQVRNVDSRVGCKFALQPSVLAESTGVSVLRWADPR